jgi:hypothetical protein
MSAAESVKSLGLQVTRTGKGAEVWFVGSGGSKEDVDSPLGAEEPQSVNQECEKTR